MTLILFLVVIGVTTAALDLRTTHDEDKLNAVLRKYCKFTGRCGQDARNIEANFIARTINARDDIANQLEELEDNIISESGKESERIWDDRDIERDYRNYRSNRNRDTDNEGNDDRWDNHDVRRPRDRDNDYDRRDRERRDRDYDKRDRGRYDDRDFNNDRRDRDDNRKASDDKVRIDYRKGDDARNDRDNDRSDSDEYGNDDDWGKDFDIRRRRDYDKDGNHVYDSRDRKRDNIRLDKNRMAYGKQYNTDGTFTDITRSGSYGPNDQYTNNGDCDACDEPEEDDCNDYGRSNLRCGCSNSRSNHYLRCGCSNNDLRCGRCNENDLRCGCSIKHDLTRCGGLNKDLRNDKPNSKDQVVFENLLNNFNDLANDKVKSYEGEAKSAANNGDRTINQIFNVKSNHEDDKESLPPKNMDYLRCGCSNNDLRCGCSKNELRCGRCNNKDLRCGCSIKHDITRGGALSKDLRNNKPNQNVLESLLNDFDDFVNDKVSYEQKGKPGDKTDQPVSDNDGVATLNQIFNVKSNDKEAVKNFPVKHTLGTGDLRCGCSNNNLRCGCSNNDLRCGCSNNDLRCGCSIKHDNVGRINDEHQIVVPDVLNNFYNDLSGKHKSNTYYVNQRETVDDTHNTPNDIKRTLDQIFNFKTNDKSNAAERSYPSKYTDDGKMLLKLKENDNQNAEKSKLKSHLRFQKELIIKLSLDYLINPSATFQMFERHNIYLDDAEKDFLKYARSNYSPFQFLVSKDLFKKAVTVLLSSYYKRPRHVFEQETYEHQEKKPHEHVSKAVNAAVPNPNKNNMSILAYFPVGRRNEQKNTGLELSQKSQLQESSQNPQPHENIQKSQAKENSQQSQQQERSQKSQPSYGFPFELQLEGLGQVKI